MDRLISFESFSEPLIVFSTTHISAMLVVLASCIFFALLSRKLESDKNIKAAGYILGTFIFLQQMSLYVWYSFSGEWSVSITLPLQLCDLSIFISIIIMIKRRQYLMEFLYFWGLGGATQAIITPDIGSYTFPHYVFYQFFMSHGLIIIAVIFILLAYRFRPTFKSVIRVFVLTNIYGIIIFPINYITGGNYLFLHEKPSGGSILDFMGPWPWYLLSLEALAAAIFMLLYLPFCVKKIERPSRPLNF